MAQQNKKNHAGSASKMALEKDLMADVVQRQSMSESGKDESFAQNGIQKIANRHQIRFEVKQGVRRRHPDSVLSNYAGLVDNVVAPRNEWDKMLELENNRESIPSEGKKNSSNMVTQLGLVRTAEVNFKASKPKLSSMYMN